MNALFRIVAKARAHRFGAAAAGPGGAGVTAALLLALWWSTRGAWLGELPGGTAGARWLPWAALCTTLVGAGAAGPRGSLGLLAVCRPDRALLQLAFGAALACFAAPWLAMTVHLWSHTPLDAAMVLRAEVLVTVGALVGSILRSRRAHRALESPTLWARWLGLDALWCALRGRPAVLLMAAALVVLGAAREATEVPVFACIREAMWAALGRDEAGRALFATNVGDSRLGDIAVYTAGHLAFEGVDGRFMHGLSLGLTWLGAYLAAGRISGSRALGWAAGALAAAGPWTLLVPLIDENLLTMPLSALTLALALDLRAAPHREGTADGTRTSAAIGAVGLGLLFGLLLTMRVPFVAMLPAACWLAYRARGPRGVLGLLLVVIAVTLPVHLHHVRALGSALRFESTAQVPPLAYELFGVEVRWRGLLGWPLHDTVVRTPHAPFPTAWRWLLWHADLFGTAVCALGLLGLLSRRGRWLVAAWVPVVVGLAVQEGWDHSNKMGVMLIVVPWFTTLAAAGARSRRGLLIGAVGLALLAPPLLSPLSDVHVAPDERYGQVYPENPAVESAAWLAWRRAVEAEVRPWPDWSRAAAWAPVLDAARWRSRGQLRPPEVCGVAPGELMPPGDPVLIELVADEPPWRGRGWWRRADAGSTAAVDVDIPELARRGGQVVVRDLRVPWEDTPVQVTFAAHARAAMLVEARFDPHPASRGGCPAGGGAPGVCGCGRFDRLAPGASAGACAETTVLDAPADRPLRVRVPSGTALTLTTINPVGHVAVRRALSIAPSGEVQADVPRLFWHN